MIKWYLNPKSGRSANETEVKLGSIANDRGNWTDFVIRQRINPFSKTTTVKAGDYERAIPGTYPGNAGILEIWKSVGACPGKAPCDPSKRAFRKVFSRVDRPFGNAPNSTHGGISLDFRAYKFTWLQLNGKPAKSTVDGPVVLGYDEIRWGFADKGTKLADVRPGGRLAAVPMPPTLTVN